MMHMLSCFKLQPGASLEEFNSHLEAFSQHLQELGLVEGHSPVGALSLGPGGVRVWCDLS